jgi:hypothetical protein
MTLSLARSMEFIHERRLGRPSCPKCGALVLASEASAYLSDGRICHKWQCDDCSYDFRTIIKVAA